MRAALQDIRTADLHSAALIVRSAWLGFIITHSSASSSKCPLLTEACVLGSPLVFLIIGAIRNEAVIRLSYSRSFICRRRSLVMRLRSSMSNDRCEIISARNNASSSNTAVANFPCTSGYFFINLSLGPGLRLNDITHSPVRLSRKPFSQGALMQCAAARVPGPKRILPNSHSGTKSPAQRQSSKPYPSLSQACRFIVNVSSGAAFGRKTGTFPASPQA